MKKPLFISLIALLLSGISLLAQVLYQPAPPDRGMEAEFVEYEQFKSKLLEQTASLSKENQGLRGRLMQLEMQPAPELRLPAMDGFASKDDLHALRVALEGALASGEQSLDQNPAATEVNDLTPQFTNRVAAAMKEIQNQQARQENLRWVSTRSQRLADQLPEVASSLGLDTYQQSKMQESLQTLYQAQADMKFAVQSGDQDRASVGESWQGAIKTLMDDLSGVLTQDQLALYGELGGNLFPIGSGKGK
jgi:hypothetical protein